MNLLAAALLILCLSGCSNEVKPRLDNVAAMEIASPAFPEGQPIPDKYTGHGNDVSPPLQWSGAPPQTKSFALICDDPDAPMGTFTHWVIYNLPATNTAVSENIPKTETLPDGSQQGKNSFDNVGYNGPAPPPGKPHHYYFTLYALDTMLNLAPGSNKDDLLHAMDKHVLAVGELIGTYQSQ